jgi:hypothetical protein
MADFLLTEVASGTPAGYRFNVHGPLNTCWGVLHPDVSPPAAVC